AEPEKTRQGTLELCILVALADNVLRYSEIHTLTVVAEALRFTIPGGLDRTFRKITGRPLPELGDPGRQGHWDDEAGGQRGGGGPRGAPPPGDEVDVERMQALATLGLSGDPTGEEIKAAYRRLVKVHHPDKFAQLGPDATKAAQEVFLRLHAAYERLMP
ncbi:DnaJ domain-containing protein, partial [Planctomycetota bacterium]|nr:DnaJ domain-containing protein [Planctomycetota bacterium]